MADAPKSSRLPFSRVSARLDAPGSDVWKVHYDALARYERGEDILLLSVGDPDFDTPDYISEHVIERIKAGRTHYSTAQGETHLRQAIADLERRGTGIPFSAEQVSIFPGATAALYAVFASILDEGDSVVVPEPMYVGYHSIFDALGADLTTVPLQPPNFELDVEALLRAVKPTTKAVLVNTPGNPCGNIVPPESLAQLAKACRERNLWLVCDEVYSLITFDRPHISLLKCTDSFDNIAVIDGLSKSHAMTGWRLGWVIGSQALVDAATRFSGAAFFGVSQFIQDGAAFALANDAQDVEIMRKAYEARRDYAMERLDRISGLSYFQPAGGMFIMIDASGVANDGDSFSERLLEGTGISTIPGNAFGPSARSYVRLSLTMDEAQLGNAFDRIERMLGTASDKEPV
ncbi:MAG: pyridoxal phosphate-dependent aminotransferase [Pseudomonadota bacterium]